MGNASPMWSSSWMKPTARPRISIIIPALNEERLLPGLLDHLQSLRPYEILVVDGRSTDATAHVAAGRAKLIDSEPGRGRQLNAGARAAAGDVLLFLHADVRLGAGALEAIAEAKAAGGNLDIIYEGGWEAAVFTWINRIRRRCGVFYGDSGIFCHRDVFEGLGGYRDWPILEDYELARRLRRAVPLALLNTPIYVSARRWQRQGLLATLWSWFWVQALYLAGVSPHRLAGWYKAVR
jgi:rSAM/selenodomain-associated transferase 2